MASALAGSIAGVVVEEEEAICIGVEEEEDSGSAMMKYLAIVLYLL